MTQLKRAIEDQGRRQVWVAKQIGVDPQRLHRWVQGQGQVPDKYKVKLSKLLKVPVQKLFFNEERNADL